MKKTSKFSRFFKFMWLQHKPADEKWDKLLNLLIDKSKVTHMDDYTITFDNKFVVWISNHPFSSGKLYECKGEHTSSRCHCSKKTKIKLEDFYYNLKFQKEIEHYSSM